MRFSRGFYVLCVAPAYVLCLLWRGRAASRLAAAFCGCACATSFWRLCVASLPGFFADVAAIGGIGDFGRAAHLLKSVSPPQSSLFSLLYFASILLALAHSSRKLVFFADAYVAVLVGVRRRRRVPDSPLRLFFTFCPTPSRFGTLRPRTQRRNQPLL